MTRLLHLLRSVWLRSALAVLVIILTASYAGCCAFTRHLVAKEDRDAQRDPVTGIRKGFEPRAYGDPASSNAALLIHGYIGAGQNFGELPERLAAQGWYVRAILLPGHGTSARDLDGVAVEDLLRAAKEEASALRVGHTRLIIVGHSMGGALASILAPDVPADGLVLVAPYYGVTRKWYYILSPETWIRIGSPLFRYVYKGKIFMQVNRPEAKGKILSYRWLPTSSLRMLSQLGDIARQPGDLSRVTCPVLLVHSEGDVAASPGAAKKALEVMGSKDKTSVWFTRSNHHILFDYDREEAIAAILDFARRVAVSSEAAGG